MLPGVVTSARLWGTLVALAAVLRGAAALEQQELFHWDTDGQPVVRTAKGSLKGLREESVGGNAFLSFYAVPYAQPPLHGLRFQAPVEEEAWTGERDAASQPEPCIQVTFKRAKLGAVSEDDVIGSEDCLYLNVFTRKVGVGVDAGLPVMVYLHGGGWVGGAAHEYQPHVLLDHAVVLVVPQFRLGTLGFLSTEDEVMPGNYMLRDQLAALEWVQRNIRTFGGDPTRVTLFGQSAGGACACLLSLSPRARGLFSRTVCHSGTALSPFAFGRRHRQVAEETATSMGLTGKLDSRSILSFLQTVSSKTLTLLSYEYYKWFVVPLVMVPRVDGDLIPEDPFKMMQTMMCPPWQLMSGYTAQDGALLTHHFYNRESLRKRLRENFPEIGPLTLLLADDDKNAMEKTTALYKHYLGEVNDTHLSENYTQFMTDYFYGVPSDLMALAHAACPTPTNRTFTFRFSHRGGRSSSDRLNVTIGKHWVTHMDDLIYLFPVDALLGGAAPLSNSDDLALRRIMSKLWVNFATTGNPTPDDSLGFRWDAVGCDRPRNLNLTPSPAMEADPLSQVREFYREVLPQQDELLTKLERSRYTMDAIEE